MSAPLCVTLVSLVQRTCALLPPPRVGRVQASPDPKAHTLLVEWTPAPHEAAVTEVRTHIH